MRYGVLLSALGGAILVASQFLGATPGPSLQPLVPLETSQPDAVRTIESAPFIQDGDAERVPGVVIMHVSAEFNTGMLASVEPSVQLISDHSLDQYGAPLPFRSVTVYVPEANIDAFIAGASQLPGVGAIDKAPVARLSMTDPLWAAQ